MQNITWNNCNYCDDDRCFLIVSRGYLPYDKIHQKIDLAGFEIIKNLSDEYFLLPIKCSDQLGIGEINEKITCSSILDCKSEALIYYQNKLSKIEENEDYIINNIKNNQKKTYEELNNLIKSKLNELNLTKKIDDKSYIYLLNQDTLIPQIDKAIGFSLICDEVFIILLEKKIVYQGDEDISLVQKTIFNEVGQGLEYFRIKDILELFNICFKKQ